ncbi:MAG: hypothetical protein II602_02890, partial [Erysipelotrichales bacterium]|nr:hypothetical protein [Erysipelotrichales bacterium]
MMKSWRYIKMEFYKCAHCGNIVAYIQDSGV